MGAERVVGSFVMVTLKSCNRVHL